MTGSVRGVFCVVVCIACAGPGAPLAAGRAQENTRELFAYQVREPARYDTTRTTQVEGIELRDISYKSPRGGTVTAFLLVPPGKGPFPVVIYGHWGNGTRSAFLPEALMLARAGVVTFLADAPFARALDSYKPINGPEARDVYIQTVVDTRYALDFLARETYVDPSRVAYVGLSFGAQVGAILAGVDPRVHAFVLMGGLPSLARALERGDQPPLVRLREGLQDKSGFERFLASLAEIDSERFVRGDHAPIFFQFGRYDAAIPEAAAREFFTAATPPKEERWYSVGHEFNDLESLNDRLSWLGRRLRFTPPCATISTRCEPR